MKEDVPQNIELTPEELQALPERVRQYISALESKIDSYRLTLSTTSNELRKKQFAYWNSKSR